MLNSKCLPNISSSSVVYDILTAHGFKKIESGVHQIYEAKFTDTATQLRYYFYIPTRINRLDHNQVSFGNVYFDRSKTIPTAILQAAKDKLLEIADYLNHVKKPNNMEEKEILLPIWT
jgi:hypothetical protein